MRPRRVSRRESRRNVVAARVAVNIQNFAAEVEPVHQLRFHSPPTGPVEKRTVEDQALRLKSLHL